MTINPKFSEENEKCRSEFLRGMDYHFSTKEMIALARIFRKNQADLPEELSSLSNLLEEKIYASLSMAEVTKLFS